MIFDNLAATNTLPTDTVGQPGNTIDAFAAYVSAQLNYKLGNTAGYNVYGQGGVQTDPDLVDKNQSAKWVSSYVTLANTFNCSFASNIYTLTPKTLATGNTYALPYQLPTILQNDMPFQFVASNSNTTTSSIAITGLTSALPIVKTNNASGTLTYSTLSSGDIIAGQKIIVIYNSTAASGSPAFVIHRQFASQLSGSMSSATTTSTGVAYLPQQIVLSNNVTTPNTVMDWAAGVFQFSDGTGQAVLSAITKSLASNWAVGTGNGGLDTGTKANSTWYHCYAIYNPTTGISDALFSVGAVTPTSLPSGYTKYKRIGSVVTDSSGNIRPGKFLFGNGFYYFTYNSPSLDVNATAQGTSAVLYTIPAPLGLKTTAFMNISAARGVTPTSMYFSDPDSTDLAPSVTVAPLAQLYMGNQDVDRVQTLEISTNTSSQIRTRWSNSDGSTTMKIAITKFLDITN